MATKTIVIDVCDRCGGEHNRADYMKGDAWGQVNISYKGDHGGRGYTGDAGGANTEGKLWLCRTCAEDFYEFIKGKSNE